MNINIEDIYPLTDFKQHSSKYLELLKNRRSAIVLTVNGKAAFVLQDAATYQQAMDRLVDLESELQQLKERQFKEAAMVGIQQIEEGLFSGRTHDEIFQAALEAEKKI